MDLCCRESKYNRFVVSIAAAISNGAVRLELETSGAKNMSLSKRYLLRVTSGVTCRLVAHGCHRAVVSMITVLGGLGWARGVYLGVCREGKITHWSIF